MSLEDELLGSAVLRLGFLTRDKLDDLKARIRSESRTLKLALLQEGVLSEDALTVVQRYANARQPIGNIVDQGFGKYRIISELGRGAMGIVYEAEDQNLGRSVALKILNGFGNDEDDEAFKRFEREARLSAQLGDNAIVTIYEAGVESGFPYIAMQLVRGSTFDAVLKRAAGANVEVKPAPEELVTDLKRRVGLIRRVAEAVHSAHEKNVIHRDLKPANILVDAKGEPYITDFGLAREMSGLGSLTGTGMTVGTPAYMAPEQASGKHSEIDARTDVYALGVLLYHSIALRRPFDEDTIMKLMQKICEVEPPPPSTFQKDIDRSLEVVCLKAMAKRKEDRYASAKDLADDLIRWLGGEPVSARPPSGMQRIKRFVHKRMALIGSIAGAVVVIAVVLLVFLGRSAVFAFSAPETATVQVDGRRVEGNRIELSAGVYEVVVTLEGHRTIREQIALEAGETLSRRFEPVPLQASLRISTEGLRLRIMGPGLKLETGTPWASSKLVPGEYEIRVWNKRSSILVKTVVLEDSDDITLDPKPPSALYWETKAPESEENIETVDVNRDGILDVVVPTWQDKVVLLDGRTGEILFARDIEAPARSSPGLVDADGDEFPEVAVGLKSGELVIYSGRDFFPTYRLHFEQRPFPAHTFEKVPGSVIALTQAGRLRRLSLTGDKPEVIWTQNHDESARYEPIVCDLDGDGEMDIVMATAGQVCLHRASDGGGSVRFTYKAEPYSPLLALNLDDDQDLEVVFGLRDGRFMAVDPVRQTTLWTFRAEDAIRTRPKAADLDGDGKPEILFGSNDGHIYAVKTDGSLFWKYRTGDEVHAEAAVGDVNGDGKVDVVFGSDDNQVYVLNGQTGRRLWSFDGGSDMDASIKLIDIEKDGVFEIIAAGNDGRVFCLKMIRRN